MAKDPHANAFIKSLKVAKKKAEDEFQKYIEKLS